MDKLIKALLIANIVAIGGNSLDTSCSLKRVVTCDNCFRGYIINPDVDEKYLTKEENENQKSVDEEKLD